LIVAAVPRIWGAVLQSLRKARIIVRNGVGYDNIDAQGARAMGIAVANVPDYCTEEVADHAITLAIALERRFHRAIQDVRTGRWTWTAAIPVRRLRGQTFGIVGCGRIGTAVALRTKAFGFRAGFYDPYSRPGYEKAIGVTRFDSLDALLEASDMVSLHAPLTAETLGMIGECQLAGMKPGAFLVNTARGPLVQERPLIGALNSGRLAGAALDVLEREPAFDPELVAHPNCLLTPHMAFYSEEAMEEVRVSAARTVLEVLRGAVPRNVVN
jgi:phosphoglycerate dehydrogenase-like enzyme